MTIRRVVLCADDYGLSAGVSRGIRALLEAGRISATSCMVVYPEFEADGATLKPYFDKADIGLHFTLTAEKPVGALMRAAYLRRLDVVAVAEELERQLATFASVMGRVPDYIDGHQHVHLLPGVREAVANSAHRIGAYVRSTREPIDTAMSLRPSPVEAAFLSWTGRPFQRLIGELDLVANRGFRGVRTFREAEPYRAIFKRMMAGAKEGCLIMCHPGFVDGALPGRDAVTGAREEELRYFAGEDFPGDLAAAGLALSRLGNTLPSNSARQLLSQPVVPAK